MNEAIALAPQACGSGYVDERDLEERINAILKPLGLSTGIVEVRAARTLGP